MRITARLRARNPLTLAVFQRSFAIEPGSNFYANPRPAQRHARNITNVKIARLRLQHASFDFDSGVPQALQTCAGDQRIGILHGHDHARYFCANQRIRAWRRAPLVAAWLQRDIDGRAIRIMSCLLKRDRFCVGLTGALVPAFRDHPGVAHDHAADPWIRCRCVQAFRCQA